MEKRKISPMYKIIRAIVKVVYPKIETVGEENLPVGEAIIVGNHTQMNGPISSEFYVPGEHYTWCAGQMMELKKVPKYAFEDFWSEKPRYIKWFYKIASYIIAPLSVLIFNNANTIAVHRDSKIVSTFKNTVTKLKKGAKVVIFPEHNEKYNNIIYNFQDRFIDVAKLYYKKTGKEIEFVPLYIAPTLRKMYFGRPIRFCAENTIEEERKRICEYLMSEITKMARDLPRHIVIPYRNIPKKQYCYNISEERENEKTCC